jgi:cob(I)alamin adenosyltransferase
MPIESAHSTQWETVLDQNLLPLPAKTISTQTTQADRSTVIHSTSPQIDDRFRRTQIRIIDTPGDRFANEIVAEALKIAGMGQRVLVVQLLKGGIRQGHDRIVNLAQNLDWIRCNSIRNISTPDLNELELHNFQQLWQHVRDLALTAPGEAVPTNAYSLIILDELSLAIELGLISIESVTHFLTDLPEDVQLVLTGTTNPPSVIRSFAN